jgi:hypothetical protein
MRLTVYAMMHFNALRFAFVFVNYTTPHTSVNMVVNEVL